jgi:L-lactate utilization protein LutB
MAAHVDLTADGIRKADPLVKDLEHDKYRKLVTDDVVESTKKALEGRGHKAYIVNNSKEAMELIKTLIPNGASVMNAGSITLQEIGFSDHLKTQTNWKNLHGEILAEKDPAKAAEMRRKAMTADWFVSSVTAVSRDGMITVCDATGSRVGAFSYAAGHVLAIIGAQKIVANLEEAIQRTEKYSLPMESARSRIVYKVPGSAINNMLIINGESPWAPHRIHVVIVKEVLGY